MTSITDILAMAPCPFCGANTFIRQNKKYDVDGKTVQCICGSHGPVKTSDAEAVKAWNNRHPTQEAILGKKLAEAVQNLINHLSANFKDDTSCWVVEAQAALAEWNKLGEGK